MTIITDFNLEEIVFLVTDEEQKKRQKLDIFLQRHNLHKGIL